MKHLTKYSFITTIVFLIFLGSCDLAQNNSKSDSLDKLDYTEDHRLQFHFSPEANWMNDPNGMVYLDGEYHLFYQYYPDSNVWGPMHWGHAVSEDLVHWEHLPIALYPDSLGYIFSGSAVIDHQNTSGLGTADNPPMIAIFTHHDPIGEKAGEMDFQYQSIAYSLDKGRTFKKYEGNPVITNPGIRDFRDPKVTWDEDSEQWVMVFAAHDHVKIYGSKNLIDWTFLSDWGKEYGEHGGVWECPDLFPMHVDGSGEKKWVLLQSLNPGAPNGGSGTQYFIGNFDGQQFILDPTFEPFVTGGKSVWLDYGKDNYAGVTWSNVPESDGRTLFIGWMSNWQYATIVPTTKWRSAMTLPRELILEKDDQSYFLRSVPIDELSKIEEGNLVVLDTSLNNDTLSLVDGEFDLLKIDVKFDRPEQGNVIVKFSNDNNEFIAFSYASGDNRYSFDRRNAGIVDFSPDFPALMYAPVQNDNNKLEFSFYVDVSSLEVFADDGRTVLTNIHFPQQAFTNIEVISTSHKELAINCEINKLKAVW